MTNEVIKVTSNELDAQFPIMGKVLLKEGGIQESCKQ